MSTDDIRSKIDTSVPHSARFWNYFLGGKDNYPVDRALGDQIATMAPGLVDVARGSREYIIRSVTYLAGEMGIRQFLDIGTGLPTANNTHEVARRGVPPPTSTPTCTTRRRSCGRLPGRWTSPRRSRSCSWASWGTSKTMRRCGRSSSG